MPDQANSAPPIEWTLDSNPPEAYEVTIDDTVKHGGKQSSRLASVGPSMVFGATMQTLSPNDYFGKRLRISGWIKTQDVRNWCGLWGRIDGKNGGEPLAFDNMAKRAIKGTRDWQKCDIVMDVPNEAAMIAYGVLLTGGGIVWLDDVKFEVVANDVPTTAKTRVPKADGSDFRR
jgi:hypothetical protein